MLYDEIKFGTGKSKKQPPQHTEGYDEAIREWIKVRYCPQSNRFFDLDGAVYPISRMNKWRKNI